MAPSFALARVDITYYHCFSESMHFGCLSVFKKIYNKLLDELNLMCEPDSLILFSIHLYFYIICNVMITLKHGYFCGGSGVACPILL
jgi:hypothetical protein